jgi:hypothetical protein
MQWPIASAFTTVRTERRIFSEEGRNTSRE